MISRVLIEFQPTEGVIKYPDFYEKASNWCLKPLRLAFGKHFVYGPGAHGPGQLYIKSPQISKIRRVIAALFAVIFFPITLLGIACALKSKNLLNSYVGYVLSLDSRKPDGQLHEDTDRAMSYAGHNTCW